MSLRARGEFSFLISHRGLVLGLGLVLALGLGLVLGLVLALGLVLVMVAFHFADGRFSILAL